MNVAFAHDWLTGMRGGEKCLDAMARQFPGAPLLTLFHRRGAVSPAIESLDVRTSWLQSLPGMARYYRGLLPLMPSAMARLRAPRDVDIVLSFSHAVAKAVAIPPGVPHVCYCFTPMRYAWRGRVDYLAAPLDGSNRASPHHRYLANLARRPLRKAQHALLDRLRDWDRTTERNVTQFLAVSQTVAERIRECYGRDSRVIYPPVDTSFYTPERVAREDYYLCVSALVPYKRLDLAIDACRRLGRKLVVIGAGPERRRLAAIASADVSFLGWTSDEAIRDYLRRCRALLFPGREDFGIVPVEAQACGTPVIAYGAGGATESIVPANSTEQGSGVFFQEPSTASLISAIEWFEDHLDACDAALAREGSLRFSTGRYVEQMLAALSEVTRASSSSGANGMRGQRSGQVACS